MIDVTPACILDIDFLKKNHLMIHYFGLGFIQIKINDIYRAHFYTFDLPITSAEEEIHNHRYSFRSQIVKGTLRQKIYALKEGDSHLLIKDACAPGSKPEGEPIPTGITMLADNEYTGPQSEYFIAHKTFHTVEAISECITLLNRGPYKKELADIVYPKENKLVCPFSENVSEDKLWEIVEGIIND